MAALQDDYDREKNGGRIGPQSNSGNSVDFVSSLPRGSLDLRDVEGQNRSAASSTASVVRVRGLPLDKKLADTLVKDVIDRHLNESVEYQISVIPSCEWEGESIALIDFAGLPRFLSSLKSDPLSSWQAAIKGVDLSFDRHFIGFTQLYEVEDDIEADVIALCGIDGHAYGSWQGRGTLRRMWLRHFLHKDLPHCRVLIYGYNAKLVRRSFASAEDYAIEFMEALKMVRTGEAAKRPIIFVAHSFGGLILARSIIKAKQLDTEPACSSIKGILLFAVPHRGIDVEDMSRIMEADEHPRAGLLEHISVESTTLKAQLKDFVSLIQDMKIISFYETGQSRRLVRDEIGDWKRSGEEYFTSLKADNAVLHLPSSIETRIPLHEDHSTIVKFDSRSDLGYKYAMFHLQEFMKTPKKVEMTKNRLNENVGADIQLDYSNEEQVPPKVHYMVPFRQNRRFVGRELKLKDLDEWFTEDEYQRLAIVGLGGIGKTQLALAFCNAVKTNYKDCSIFWVSALSMARFRQDYSSISQYSLVPFPTNEIDAIGVVKEFLSSESAGKWLLIIDNADDTRFFQDKDDNITDYLPDSETGKILFTTRHRDALVDIVDRNLLVLDEMSMEEAESFLGKSLGRRDLSKDRAMARELLTELTCLPLAIVQASSYMVKKSVSISQYLSKIRNTEAEMVRLLSQDFADNTRDKESQNALAVTWLVSFDQIKRDDPDAADVLFFLAFIENKAIPLSLLPANTDGDLADAIGTLLGYSFLSRKGDDEVYDMHRLVHRAIRIWMQTEAVGQWKEIAINNIAEKFPRNQWKNRILWQEYMPHAIRILQDTESTPSKERALLCKKVGMALDTEGRTKEALTWLSACVTWRDQWLVETNQERLEAQRSLAMGCLRNGQVNVAIELLEKVVSIQSKELPENDRRLLQVKCNLATCYHWAGENREALMMLEDIQARLHDLAEDDEDLLHLNHLLSQSYLNDGQPEKAIELLERVVKIMATTQGETNPKRLIVQHGLASAYLKDGQVQKAIELLEHVVKIRAITFAENHRERLGGLLELARAYLDDGQVQKAIELLEHVVKIEARTLAENHPDRLISQHELARAYLTDGQVQKSIELLEHVVKIEARTLAENHPDRLISQRVLAEAYLKEGVQVKKAVELLENVVLHRAELKPSNKDRLATEEWLADAYSHDGQVDRAILLMEHVLNVRREFLKDNQKGIKRCKRKLDRLYRQREETGNVDRDG